MQREALVHPFGPVYDENARVLLLGSFPSPLSRQEGFFYGNPRNRFWPVLAAVFDEPLPQSIEEKRALCRAHGVALWDVLASCEIKGAADASIASPKPNDLAALIRKTRITAVFSTGQAAAKLYRRFCERETGLPVTALPSTSPANAAWSLEMLIEAYRAVAAAAEGR